MTPSIPADPEAPTAVDLRSDTVTRPTPAMYERMLAATVGDDGLDGDATVRALEETAAAALGKEAGLFVPSCTMANLLATLAQVGRGEQVVLEAQSHMHTSERGAATFTGAFHLGIAGTGGAMDLDALKEALCPGANRLRTALVALETSHNNAGGAVPPLAHMEAAAALARAGGAAVHLDGARLFNAATHLGVPPATVAAPADTVSLCLSKGLSAPVGAILAGRRSVIEGARRFRKMIGGTQRQLGIMAAAGLEAVTVMGARLGEDHAQARLLSEGLNRLGPALSATVPQTNIVQVDVSRTGHGGERWVAALEAAGVRVRPWGRARLRCVTHRHVDAADIARAVDAFRLCLHRHEAAISVP